MRCGVAAAAKAAGYAMLVSGGSRTHSGRPHSGEKLRFPGRRFGIGFSGAVAFCPGYRTLTFVVCAPP